MVHKTLKGPASGKAAPSGFVLGGEQPEPSASVAHEQARDDERASRRYYLAGLTTPGLLGQQGVALASFYGSLQRVRFSSGAHK